MENMLTYTKLVRKLFREELCSKNSYSFIVTNNYPKCRTVKVYIESLKSPCRARAAVRELLDGEGLVEGVDYAFKTTTASFGYDFGAFIVRFAK